MAAHKVRVVADSSRVNGGRVTRQTLGLRMTVFRSSYPGLRRAFSGGTS